MFRRAAASLLFLASSAVALCEEPIVDVDFSKCGPEVHRKARGSFDGVLPIDVVEDFPAWNTSQVEAKKMEENGRTFIRFDVKKFDYLVLFRMPGAPMPLEPGYYEIKIRCRTPDNPLNAHIRMLGKPYTTICEADSEQTSSWKDYEFILPVAAKKAPFSNVVPDLSKLGLYLSLKPGTTDIASVKMEKSSREAYVALMGKNIERPKTATANYFRDSRFPLGLPSGWNVNRDNFRGQIVSDPENPGPSGSASLKFASGPEYMRLYTAPFQVADPKEKCHLSFAYKADAEWQASIGGVAKKLPPTKDWKTVEMSFSPDPLAKGFSMAFSGKGDMWLDSLMAHSGDKARPYASAGDCEIALAPDGGDAASARIQFLDEPPKVKYVATGKIDGAVLKAKVANIYGDECALPDAMLSKSGEIAYDVFKKAPLGAFRIEVWAERDGKRVSPYNEIVMNRVRRPLYWGKDAPNSPFGNHFLPNPQTLKIMKASGINWARFNDASMELTCWGWLETEKGKWNFQDDKVAAYRDAKIKILGQIGTAPTWASYWPGVKSAHYFDYTYQPKDIEAFKNYVRVLSSHYKGVIDEYQFQNEPWGTLFWHKSYDPKTGSFGQGENPAKDYAEFSKIAYEELKKANPDANMYGFNSGETVKNDNKEHWTKAVFDAGAYPYCDMMDYHSYNGARELCLVPDDKAERSLKGAFDYVKARVPQPMKPVVNSEGNPTRGGAIPTNLTGCDSFTGLYKHTIPWTSKDDNPLFADMSCRFVISHLVLGVKRIFLYSDHCYSTLLNAPSFPVLLAADGSPHPALAAFSNMAYLLEDMKFVKRVEVGKKVWAYVFEGRGVSLAVVSGEKNGEYLFKRASGVEAVDLFGNPVEGDAKYSGRIFYLKSALPPAKLEALLATGK